MDPATLSPSVVPRRLVRLAFEARERTFGLLLLAGALPTIRQQGAFAPISQQVQANGESPALQR